MKYQSDYYRKKSDLFKQRAMSNTEIEYVEPVQQKVFQPHKFDAKARYLQQCQKKGRTWYPRVKLSSRIVYDQDEDQNYKVTKVYDDDGSYKYIYDAVTPSMIKSVGTNYYRPYYGI